MWVDFPRQPEACLFFFVFVFVFVFGEAGLHQFPDEGGRQRLVDPVADGLDGGGWRAGVNRGADFH